MLSWKGEVKIGRRTIFTSEPLVGRTPTQALQELIQAFYNATDEGYFSPKALVGLLILEKGITNELNLKFRVKPIR